MELPVGLILDVTVDCEGWQEDVPDYKDIINKVISQVITHVPQGKQLKKFTQLELGIILCDNAFIKNLNSKYRDQDKATNVLAFEGLNEAHAELLIKDGESAPEFPVNLGEVYIAHGVMLKEAVDANISLRDHFTHLVIHGILHLLGYDHIENEEAEIMEALETQLLRNLAIDDPYIA